MYFLLAKHNKRVALNPITFLLYILVYDEYKVRKNARKITRRYSNSLTKANIGSNLERNSSFFQLHFIFVHVHSHFTTLLPQSDQHNLFQPYISYYFLRNLYVKRQYASFKFNTMGDSSNIHSLHIQICHMFCGSVCHTRSHSLDMTWQVDYDARDLNHLSD